MNITYRNIFKMKLGSQWRDGRRKFNIHGNMELLEDISKVPVGNEHKVREILAVLYLIVSSGFDIE